MSSFDGPSKLQVNRDINVRWKLSIHSPDGYLRNSCGPSILMKRIFELTARIESIEDDVQFIKSFFLAKEAKKQRRREKKLSEALEAERAKNARKARSEYEYLIWGLGYRPWDVMPFPKSSFSPKELAIVKLLAQDNPKSEIAKLINLKEKSIGPRICEIQKRIGVHSEAAIVEVYRDYVSTIRQHMRRRCLMILSSILFPPEGFIHRRNLKVRWIQRLGVGNQFRRTEFKVPSKFFEEELKPYQHKVLSMLSQGKSYSEITSAIKIKENTVRSYMSEIRSWLHLSVGVEVPEERLVQQYKSWKWHQARRKS